MDIEKNVSDLDTLSIAVLKVAVRLLEEWRRHIKRAFENAIGFLNRLTAENPEAVECMKRWAARKESYLHRMEYLKRRKKRRRKKPKHGRNRRGGAKYEPNQKDGKDSETETSQNAGAYRGGRGAED